MKLLLGDCHSEFASIVTRTLQADFVEYLLLFTLLSHFWFVPCREFNYTLLSQVLSREKELAQAAVEVNDLLPSLYRIASLYKAETRPPIVSFC